MTQASEPNDSDRSLDRLLGTFDRVYDEIDALENQMNARFDRLDARLDRMEASTNQRFDSLDGKFDLLMRQITGQGNNEPLKQKNP